MDDRLARLTLAQPLRLREELTRVPGPGYGLDMRHGEPGVWRLAECHTPGLWAWLPCDPTAIVRAGAKEAARGWGAKVIGIGIGETPHVTRAWCQLANPQANPSLRTGEATGATAHEAALRLLAAAIGVEFVEVSDG